MSKHTGLLYLCFTIAALTARDARAQSRAADSARIVGTVERFHAALAAGDSAGAAQLLSPDLTVLESGGVESRADYLARHLGADIQFAKAVPSQRTIVSVTQTGDAAWIVATSVTRGTFRERAVNSNGAELMVLVRSGSNWLISAIHWSSRRVTP